MSDGFDMDAFLREQGVVGGGTSPSSGESFDMDAFLSDAPKDLLPALGKEELKTEPSKISSILGQDVFGVPLSAVVGPVGPVVNTLSKALGVEGAGTALASRAIEQQDWMVGLAERANEGYHALTGKDIPYFPKPGGIRASQESNEKERESILAQMGDVGPTEPIIGRLLQLDNAVTGAAQELPFVRGAKADARGLENLTLGESLYGLGSVADRKSVV